MFLHFWRNGLDNRKSKATARQPVRKQPPRSVRLSVETLEDRVVPAKAIAVDVLSPMVLDNLLAVNYSPQVATLLRDDIVSMAVPSLSLFKSDKSPGALVPALQTTVIDLIEANLPAAQKDLSNFVDIALQEATTPNTLDLNSLMNIGAGVSGIEAAVFNQTLNMTPQQAQGLMTDFAMLNSQIPDGFTGGDALVPYVEGFAKQLILGNSATAGNALTAFMGQVVQEANMGMLSTAQSVRFLKTGADINVNANLGLQLAPVVLVCPMPPVSEQADATFNAIVVTFNNESISGGTISWGDHHKTKITDDMVTDVGNGVFSISADHDYRKEGTDTITINVAFSNYSTASDSTTVTVVEEQNEHQRTDGEQEQNEHQRSDNDQEGQDNNQTTSTPTAKPARIEFKT